MRARLAELIQNKGLTSSKFADLVGVQPSNISHILSGRNNPSYDLLQKILTIFSDVNPDWLLLGVGEMFRSANTVQKDDSYISNDSQIVEFSPIIELDELADVIIEDSSLHMHASDINVNSDTILPDVSAANEPVQSQESETVLPLVTNVNIGKKIVKVMVFYDDKSFSEYSPE